jgi:hypothetical protein
MSEYGHHIELELDETSPNTLFEYMYRDADNYKKTGSVVLAGRMSADQVRTLNASLSDSEFFIPGQVGLKDLQGEFEHGGGWDEESDHVWHTIEAVKHTSAAPTGPSVDELMEAWPKAEEEWDVAEHVARLSTTLPAPSRSM